MKKKTVKKLVLSKETVGRLAEAELTPIVGGGTGEGYECNPLTGLSCKYCVDEPIG